MNYKTFKKLGMCMLLVCVGLFSAMKLSASSKDEKKQILPLLLLKSN